MNPQIETERKGLSPWLKWLVAAWLTGSLLFAHGCHGDEDHELWAFSLCRLRLSVFAEER
jgi:hypothetical protein